MLALGDNAFEAKLAGVPKYGLAITFDMLVEANARSGIGHDRCERGLADLERVSAQIVAV
jgi:hypothetical protein